MARRYYIGSATSLMVTLALSALASASTVPVANDVAPKAGPKNPTIRELTATDGRVRRSKGDRKRNKSERWS